MYVLFMAQGDLFRLRWALSLDGLSSLRTRQPLLRARPASGPDEAGEHREATGAD